MSKPEEIPQDVWDYSAAVEHVYCGCAPGRSRGNGTSHHDTCWKKVEAHARAILAAKAEGLPKLDNCGKYLAQDNTGQWHYINHAGTWQGCPPPFPLVEQRDAPVGWKWQMVPDYPVGQIVGACICGSWPGGECLKCPPTSEVNTAHKNSVEV